ncbi:MAG: radical SAM protein [Candidatus Omnitrophota bacterium]|nr:MAG: radical SAM protein [Candidatus Omnitrophota bacterium]
MGLVYAKMKIFHFKDKVDSLSITKDEILPPIQIRIKPTNVCNHNCSYCSYKIDNVQIGKDIVAKDRIPREKMMEIMDDIIDMQVECVTFSGGGEPFCYPYLLEAVKRLSSTPVKFATLTNGSKLDGELAEVFAHKATWLRVSIDGWDDESYSAYRGVPKGEFTKVIRNIENFKKYRGKCYLGACIVIDKKNASHVYELIARLKDSGIDSVKIAPSILSNSSTEINLYHKPIFEQVKREIAKASDELSEEVFEIFDSYHSQLEGFEKGYTWCPYLQILPVIGADLNVYSCHDKAYNLDEGLMGSIKNRRFKDFWLSDKNKFFKIDPSRHCNHHCVVDMKNRLILDYLDADKGHLGFV